MTLPPSSTPDSQAAPPTGRERLAVVVNGNAKSVTREVIATLDEVLDSGDLFVSKRIEDAGEIARTLLDRKYGTILTAGGDGTFTVLVTAVVKEAERRGEEVPRFGILRLGTGNSLAWVLGSTKTGAGGKGARALTLDLSRLRAEAGSRQLNLVDIDGMLSPFCGFGIDANVLRDYSATKAMLAKGPLRRFAPGLFSYGLAAVTRTLPEYLIKPTPHCRVVNRGGDAHRIGKRGALVGSPIENGSVIYEGPATIASVSTIPYYGFGLRMFPYAEDRVGKMQLRISTAATVPFLKNLPEIWKGEWTDPEHLFDYYVDSVDVEMDPPTSFQIGGDVYGDRRHASMKLAKPIDVVDFYAPPRG